MVRREDRVELLERAKIEGGENIGGTYVHQIRDALKIFIANISKLFWIEKKDLLYEFK